MSEVAGGKREQVAGVQHSEEAEWESWVLRGRVLGN